jgi:hypothetical protein
VARSLVRGEAYAKLGQAKAAAAACKREENEPHGAGKVAVLFAPSGKVSAVSLDTRFVGTKVGDCVDRAFRQASVQPFEGEPYPVIWSFVVP